MQNAYYQGPPPTSAAKQRSAFTLQANYPHPRTSSGPLRPPPINPALAHRRPSAHSPVTPEHLVMPVASTPSPHFALPHTSSRHDASSNISVTRTRATPSPQERANYTAYSGQPAAAAQASSQTPTQATPSEAAKLHAAQNRSPSRNAPLKMPVPELPPGVREELARNEHSTNYPDSPGYPLHPSGPMTFNGSAQGFPMSDQNLPNTSRQDQRRGSDPRFSPQVVAPNTVQIAQTVRSPSQTNSRPQVSSSDGSAFNPKHRRFGSDAGSHNPELTVDQFETVRRQASAQPHDPRTQLELAKHLCEASECLASKYTDPFHPSTLEVDQRQQARNREAWTTQALKIAKRLATKVHYAEALFFLGSVYSSGKHGVEVDYIKALDYYQKASRLEHPEACYRVAVCEEFGVGTRSNPEKAVSWYKKAAVLGSAASMYKLGMLSMLGNLDQPRDFGTGLSWLQRAADKADAKNPHAVHELALIYEHSPLGTYTNGDNIPYNAAKSLEYYYHAAKLGYAPSQARLGRAFEFGELGCSIESSWSISWYSQAAQQGDTDAELAMAGWYWTGAPNFRKSDVEAYLWAERAASKGNARAMYAIGYFCELGIGIKRDPQRSTKWYTLAAERKNPRAIHKLKVLGSEAVTS